MEKHYRRKVHHEYKVHQMEQERIKNEMELRKKKRNRSRLIQKLVINLELILSIFIKIFNIIMIIVWCVAVSALDSETMIPAIALVISTIYLAGVAYIKGYMTDGY